MSRHRAPRTRTASLAFVGVATVGVTLLAGGIAVAAWTSTGAGNASAKAATALSPTTTLVPGSAFTSGLLHPGGTGDVKITVNNPNPYPVKVTEITGSGAVGASGGTGTCTNHGVSFTDATPTSGNAIAAGGSTTITLPGAARMATSSDSGCQNAAFSIPVTVRVESG